MPHDSDSEYEALKEAVRKTVTEQVEKSATLNNFRAVRALAELEEELEDIAWENAEAEAR